MFADRRIRDSWLVLVALTSPVGIAGMTGSLCACGTAGGIPPGEEPPLIGFVGGIAPGVGFVGGGKPQRDAGAYPVDATADGANGQNQGDGGNGQGMNGGGANDGAESSHDGSVEGSDGAVLSHDGSIEGDDGGQGIGVLLNLPPGFFVSLDWTIIGPAGSYSGTVFFGQAQSIEFVVGQIQEGAGYVLTLTGVDPSGDPCRGTSAPFSVSPGGTTYAGVTIECFASDGGARPAAIMTGNVAVDAGVVQQ